jgi:hypothetical protein
MDFAFMDFAFGDFAFGVRLAHYLVANSYVGMM